MADMMMDMETPYFMYNDDWCYYDEKADKCFLTEEGKKIEKVVKSYEYYCKIKEQYPDLLI